jgi:hypothetical protein
MQNHEKEEEFCIFFVENYFTETDSNIRSKTLINIIHSVFFWGEGLISLLRRHFQGMKSTFKSLRTKFHASEKLQESRQHCF